MSEIKPGVRVKSKDGTTGTVRKVGDFCAVVGRDIPIPRRTKGLCLPEITVFIAPLGELEVINDQD